MLSSSAFACWNMKATLSHNGSEVKFDQKINHDLSYSFMKEHFIFNVKNPSEKNLPKNIPVKAGSYLVMIDVQQKEALNIKTVSTGMIVATFGQKATMTKVDNETKATSNFTVTLTEI
jgi:hypothetical protein